MATRTLLLHALRAFEAASRHLSYSRAAEELHLTHGAISHQVRALETALGVTLFRRAGRHMLLTEPGQLLQTHVQDAFARLAHGVDIVRGARRTQILTVSVHPGFAVHWLVPRLTDFQHRHPELDVNLRPSAALADFVREDIDMGVRYGPGDWPGVRAEKLMDEEMFPVCSPRFNGGKLPRHPRELSALPLLRDARQPWTDWFRSVGLDLPEPERGPIYSDAALVLQAAIAGHGVALARGLLARPEIKAKRLVRLFRGRTRTHFAYYVVYPPRAANDAKVTAFRDWLFEQIATAIPSPTGRGRRS